MTILSFDGKKRRFVLQKRFGDYCLTDYATGRILRDLEDEASIMKNTGKAYTLHARAQYTLDRIVEMGGLSLVRAVIAECRVVNGKDATAPDQTKYQVFLDEYTQELAIAVKAKESGYEHHLSAELGGIAHQHVEALRQQKMDPRGSVTRRVCKALKIKVNKAAIAEYLAPAS